MCEPTAIAIGGLILTAGSKIAEHAGDRKADEANQEASIAAFVQDVSSIMAQVQEEQNVAVQRIQQGFKATQRARATARTAAGEGGVGGFSVDLLLDDVDRQLGEFTQSNLLNIASIERQGARALSGAAARRDSRIASGKAPSFLSTGIQIAGAGVGTAVDILDANVRRSA